MKQKTDIVRRTIKQNNKMKTKHIFIVIITIFLFNTGAKACTVAVISGKYTVDGRPLLWKNRDTWANHNQIMYFDDGKYEYMGLVNSGDKTGKSVWIGVNSEGFAIMNSASYNLNIGDTIEQSGLEGRIIKEALATCATIEDFEALLNNMENPTRLEANFGVIDGNGGAAMYELGNFSFVKFDANDPTVAPFGYIIRGNYSFTGSFGKESSGYIRYNTVNQLFFDAASTNSFDAQFIMQDVTRGLKHSLMNIDLHDEYGNIPENTQTFAFFHDFIPRGSSASACVVQGVKKGENPEFAMMWAAVGFPLTSIAIPVWVSGKNDFPEILKANADLKDSPICHAALSLKKELFPIRWGKYASKYYININALTNADNTGIRQKIKPDEDEIFNKTNAMIEVWRNNGKVDNKELVEHYDWLNDFVKNSYKSNFNINL